MSKFDLQGYDENTEVLTESGFKSFQELSSDDRVTGVCSNRLVVLGYFEIKRLVTFRYSGLVFCANSSTSNFRITQGLRLLTSEVRNYKGKVPTRFSLKKACEETDIRSTSRFHIGKELLLPNSVPPPSCNDPIVSTLGKLVGMYIGDGFNLDGAIGFHLKKDRKIRYLTEILDFLKDSGILKYSCSKNKSGTTNFRVFKSDLTLRILEVCGYGCRNKKIGTWDLKFYQYIFDGLKNSDGSIKRNTWSYATTSGELLNDFIDLAPLAGISAKPNLSHRGCHKIMVQTKNNSRINDSRTPDSKVKNQTVSNEVFYNCDTGGYLIITRRGGEILIGCDAGVT